MSTQIETKPEAQFFTLESPLLAQGRFDNHVAFANLLKLTVKVYASGGENALHAHSGEDHAFVLLQGEATFHIGEDDEVHVLRQYEGIMLPRGVLYWFQSSASENLVMLRAGASETWGKDMRVHPDGRPFAGDSLENKEVAVIPIPGAFFAAR